MHATAGRFLSFSLYPSAIIIYIFIYDYRKDRGMLIIYEPALLYVFSLLWGVCCVKLICAFRTKLCEGIEFHLMETVYMSV